MNLPRVGYWFAQLVVVGRFCAGESASRIRLLAFPECVDSLLDELENELAHVSVIRWPLAVFRVSSTRRRWGMEVIPRVVAVWVPIPPALPDAVWTLLLIMQSKIVIAIPADFEPSCCLVWIILAGEVDTEVESVRLVDPCGVGQSTASDPGLDVLQDRPVNRRSTRAVVCRPHQLWDGAFEPASFRRARSLSRRSSIAVAHSPRAA